MTSSILSLASLIYSGVNQVASNLANNAESAALQKASQGNSFGDAVFIDLSPAAMAAMRSGTATPSAPPPAANPVSNISANLFSGMAQSYSAGNKGALDSNNSFFDQLFAGIAPSASSANTPSSATKPADSTDALLESIA